jgi:hypothetical protein
MFRKRLKTGLPSIKDLREKEALSRRIERALTTGESELLTQMLGNGSEKQSLFRLKFPSQMWSVIAAAAVPQLDWKCREMLLRAMLLAGSLSICRV